MGSANKKIKVAAKIALSVTEEFLLTLWEICDEMNCMRYHPGLVMAVGGREARAILAKNEYYRKEREKKKMIWRLKKNKWIKERKEGERVEYELTNNGRIAVLEIIIGRTDSFLPDGEWCLVIFDFPEAARRSRQIFRRLLKRLGFTGIQLSVWRAKKDVVREIRELVTLLKIDRWVQVYRGRTD